MSDYDKRTNEIALDFDPAQTADDASVVFIGKIKSPWKTREECPKNIAQARLREQVATLEVDPPWRLGLDGVDRYSHLILLYWMQEARRDLIVLKPRHRPDPTGVFSLRSPARPNPIAISTVRLIEANPNTGILTIDAIDCLNGTPLVDIKPWFESIDTP
jgi:tRNA (adenine37-N6)-methyltransferase